MTRRLIVLAGALLALAALAGCGSSQHSDRPAVAKYIRRVDALEATLKTPLSTVSKAGSSLASTGKATLLGNLAQASSRQELAVAFTQIRGTQAKLAALPCPAAARHLRALVLQLTAGEADLTHQLRLLAVFLPRFGAVLTPLGPAALTLERVLAQRSAYGSAAVLALYKSKAGALRHFQATTVRLIGRLHRLQPPRVSAAEYQAELVSLHGMGTAAGRLATALAGGTPGNVQPLLVAFDRAAAATHTPAVARAQIKAIKAYDTATSRLSGLSSAIASERLRLSNTLS